MKKFCFWLVVLLVAVLAQPAWAAKKVQVTMTQTVQIDKAGWADGFEMGHSELQPQHYATINQIVVALKQKPQVRLAIKGSVSTERIINGYCFVSADYTYFSLNKSRADTKKVMGEDECQRALGFSRAIKFGKQIVSQGIAGKRVDIFVGVDMGRRSGGHSENRAVSFWYINLPEGAKLLEATEQADGKLLATYQVQKVVTKQCPLKAWWAKERQQIKDHLKPPAKKKDSFQVD